MFLGRFLPRGGGGGRGLGPYCCGMNADHRVLSELIDRLPEHLSERVRVVSEGSGGAAGAGGAGASAGTHVVLWVHHAVRGHENPALDVALHAAAELRLPLVVYQGLGGRHRFNNDRHHTFIMEGARSMWAEMRERLPGVRCVFNFQEDPSASSPLAGLCARAALVVTEEFPAPPMPAWTRRLAARCGRAVWAVDCACVVPMRVVVAAVGEQLGAFKLRGKTEKMFRARVGRVWAEVGAEVLERVPDAAGVDVGFVPVDWATADIAGLCARARIDHGVPPVAHTRGGSAAGYARWEAFKARGLKNYHKARNRAEIERDALAVSRLSAYIHHGQISPLRIVRQAWEAFKTGAGEGAEKYIDEVWVWRELAHHLCFLYEDVLEKPEIVPAWARQTLHAHRDDPRDVLSWETLARGRSGEALWDAAQRGLLAHGEMHNNVRMTWGKAIVGWSDGPARAQRMLIDLNHRYALDGNNPNSYGGLLWCLGVLDRPFDVDAPVTGCLRPRPVGEHAARMDLARYQRGMMETSWRSELRVAVIGGGMAGMAAARTLADANAHVVVFDKGRGPGGRMSTRRMDDGSGAVCFDHGAQYFTARDERFARVVESWVEDGIVAPWSGRIGQVREAGVVREPGVVRERAGADGAGAGGDVRYVGVPGMNEVIAHMGRTLGGRSEVRFGVRVARLERLDGPGGAGSSAGRWRLSDERGAGLGEFDAVIVAVPGPQAVELLSPVAGGGAAGLVERARGAGMRACWAVMVKFAERIAMGFDGLFVDVPGGVLSWAARDGSKPGRAAAAGGRGDAWVLHASPEWSEANLEREKAEVMREALAAFFSAVGLPAREPIMIEAHRWRYASVDAAGARGGAGERGVRAVDEIDRAAVDEHGTLALCGDWLGGGRVEGAYLSGVAAAGRLAGRVAQAAGRVAQAVAARAAGAPVVDSPPAAG